MYETPDQRMAKMHVNDRPNHKLLVRTVLVIRYYVTGKYHGQGCKIGLKTDCVICEISMPLRKPNCIICEIAKFAIFAPYAIFENNKLGDLR